LFIAFASLRKISIQHHRTFWESQILKLMKQTFKFSHHLEHGQNRPMPKWFTFGLCLAAEEEGAELKHQQAPTAAGVEAGLLVE
jgi:hypothetical protein